jgi:hypothetical protein
MSLSAFSSLSGLQKVWSVWAMAVNLRLSMEAIPRDGAALWPGSYYEGMLGPILRGEKISLEPVKAADLETFRGWLADLEVKGYASEVVSLRTAYAFRELGLERLETECFTENLAMHRALEKAGYQRLGRRRRHIYKSGEWHDTVIFEVLREEWEELTSEAAGIGYCDGGRIHQ